MAKKPREVPPPKLFDLLFRTLTRLDQTLEAILRTEYNIDQILRALAKAWKLEVPPPVVVPPVAVPPTVPPAIPPPVVPTVVKVTEFPPRMRSYMSVEETVEDNKPKSYEMKDYIPPRTIAKYGYVYSIDGTIKVKFNDQKEITFDAGQIEYFDRLNLEVEKISIETDSTTPVTFRVVAV